MSGNTKWTNKSLAKVLIFAAISIIFVCIVVIFVNNAKYNTNDFSNEFGVNFEMTLDDIIALEKENFSCTVYEIETPFSDKTQIVEFINGHIYRFYPNGKLQFVKYCNYRLDNTTLDTLIDKYGDYDYDSKMNTYAWYGNVNGTKCIMYIFLTGDANAVIFELDKKD